ncbi:MAG: sulfur carrier protein ThiS [Longimicrobiales bacterium]|nr:sulfur carrier protein ThiS [Longimicrobiales bacterium]
MTQETTMEIQLNGKLHSFDRAHTVASLLEALDLQPGMVVVELNREILERGSYDASEVSHGDTIELVHFVGGG